MPLVIPPSTLDVFTSLYSDTVIIDDIIEHYQIKHQVKKFLFDHYKFNLPSDAEITVYCQSQPSILIIECYEPTIQMQLDGETGQLTDINLNSSHKPNKKQITIAASCLHINWKSHLKNETHFDSARLGQTSNYLCDDCHQLLAHSTSTASGIFHKVFDQSWADRNRVTDIEY
jgi:hypothetical protein